MSTRKTKKTAKGKPNFFDFLLILVYVILAVLVVVYLNKLAVLTDALFVLVVCILVFFFVLLLLMSVIGKKSRIFERILAVLLIIVLSISFAVEAKAYQTLKKMTEEQDGQVTVSLYVRSDSQLSALSDLEGARVGYQTLVGTGNVQECIAKAKQDIWFGYSRAYSSYYDLVKALYSGDVDCIVVEKAVLNTINGYHEDEEDFPLFSENAKLIHSYIFDSVKDLEESEESQADDYVSDLTKESFIIYLSGVDSRSGRFDIRTRVDTNILVVVNPVTRNVLLLSTPRDYYVDFIVPGRAAFRDKLTHSGIYGTKVTMNTLANLYDIDQINLYAKINIMGIIDLVDAVGGITVYNEDAFLGHVSLQDATGEIVDTRERYFEVGPNYLDGMDAMVYCRERKHIASGDRARGNHQMAVIKGVVNKVLQDKSVLLNFADIFEAVGNNFSTNVSMMDISSLVKLELNDMSPWNLYSYSVNGADSTGICPTYNSTSMLYVVEPYLKDVEKAKQYIQIIMSGGDITDITPTVVG